MTRAAQRHLAGALGRPPRRGALVEVEEHVAGHLAPLVAAVEQPRRAPLLGPGAAVDERRLVDVAAQHDVGSVLLEQPGELGVAVVARAGPRQRALGRPVVHPQPRPGPLARRPRRGRPRARRSVAGPSHHAHARDEPAVDRRCCRRRRPRPTARASRIQRVAFSLARPCGGRGRGCRSRRPWSSARRTGRGTRARRRSGRRAGHRTRCRAGRRPRRGGRRRPPGSAPSRACAGRSGGRRPAGRAPQQSRVAAVGARGAAGLGLRVAGPGTLGR